MCGGINTADALNLVAEPLHTHRRLRARRETIKDPTTARVLASPAHQRDALVPECRNTLGCLIQRHAHAREKGEAPLHKCGRVGAVLERCEE